MSDHWDKYPDELRERRKSYMQRAGAVIKKLRKKAGMTQTRAGDLVCVSRQEISRYETGSVDMPYSALPVLIEDMDASVYEVMRELLPHAQDEFNLCRDIMMDLIAKSGMDTSVMDPFYPKPDIYHSYISMYNTPRHEETESLVLHDDPTMSVLDCINLVSYFAPENDTSFRMVLLQCLIRYWTAFGVKRSDNFPRQ